MKQLVLIAEGENQQPPPQQPSPFSGPTGLLFLMSLVMLFFLIVILPAQNRRARREQEKLLGALKRGTKVLTTGGIVGTIVSAKEGEDEVVLRSEDTRVRIKRTGIVQVLGTDEAEAAKS